MESEPKFRIGEECLALSRRVSPGQWLDFTVSRRHWSEERVLYKGGRSEEYRGWFYYDDDQDCSCLEPDMRKKYPPADDEFKEQLKDWMNREVTA